MSRVFSAAASDYVVGSVEYVATNDMTISVWVKINATTLLDRNEILSTEPGSAAGWECSVLFDGFPQFGQFNGSFVSATSGTALTADVWTNLIFQRDNAGDDLSAYINNSLVGTTSGLVSPAVSSILLQVGRRENSTRFFEGKIAHLAIWDVLLDNTQRTSLQTQKPNTVGSPTIYLFDNSDNVTNFGSSGITFTDNGTTFDADTPIADSSGVTFFSTIYPDSLESAEDSLESFIVTAFVPQLDFFSSVYPDVIETKENYIESYTVSPVEITAPILVTYFSTIYPDTIDRIRIVLENQIIVPVFIPVIPPLSGKNWEVIAPDVLFKKKDYSHFPSVSELRRTIALPGAASSLSLIWFYNLRVRLDVKKAVDSGNIVANAGDAGGTTVTFNKAFKDIDSITVSVLKNTTGRIAVYDFVDIPNPVSFKVLVFDTAGVRVTEEVSWKARGII